MNDVMKRNGEHNKVIDYGKHPDKHCFLSKCFWEYYLEHLL